MYQVVLATHSLVRWAVFISLLFTIYRSYVGWLGNKSFSTFDGRVRQITATISHIQLVIGICLYGISPVISYFLHNFKDAVHDRQIRFFGMEHSLMMLVGITLINIGAASSKRQQTDKAKYKAMAIWLTIALLVILSSVPWEFSPLVSRPYFRSF